MIGMAAERAGIAEQCHRVDVTGVAKNQNDGERDQNEAPHRDMRSFVLRVNFAEEDRKQTLAA